MPGPRDEPEVSDNPQPDIRTEQEMEAEARQTALDLGFVLLLSENPEKALQEAKTEFEREEALNAIKTKRIVSTTTQTHKVEHYYYINPIAPQNEIYANKAKKDLNNNNSTDNTNAFPNLQAHNDSTPAPTTTTNTEAMNEQFERLKQQQKAAEERQKKLDALVQAKRTERQAAKAPVLSLLATDEQDDQDSEESEVNHPVQVYHEAKPAMEQVAEALQKHRQQHVGEGENVELLKLTVPASLTAPKQAPAAKMTVAELMPSGQAAETGSIDPKMIANLPNRQNCAEFFLMQQNIGVRGMSIPTKETFDEVTGTAAIKLLEVTRTWVNVVEYAEVNRGGVGIIILNYGNRRAADTFRELVVQQSTDEITYQTCLLYTSPSPRDRQKSRMPSSA